MVKWILISIAVVLLGSGAYMVLHNNATEGSNPFSSSVKRVQSIFPTPTPMPFEDVTIPYLRKRTFSSTLGPKEVFTQGTSYTSYLTSYSSDGFKVNGLLTIPNGTKPEKGWPAIVFVHGYIPPTQYTTTNKYVEYVDYLAKNGFVVFKIDLRGHGDSEGEPGGGYFGADYIADTLNAYSALQKTDVVNPNAIGLWGHSMAGNVLLRSIAVKPEIPAAVMWAGAVYSYADREKYGINDTSFTPSANPTGINRRQRLTDIYGQASSGSAFWKRMAPTYFLNDIKGAIEIHHAVDDAVVNVGYSRDLISLLDKTSVPHELYEYPSGGHNISGSSFDQAMQRTVTFYKKYLVTQ